MSLLHFRTQAHHLPELELELDPPALDAGRSADEADYAEEHAREALAAEMAALRAAAPQPTPDPDGARLMMEYAADHATPSDAELAADESVSAFLDASREAFVDWLSTMGSDPHAARPGVATVRPSTLPTAPARVSA